MSLAEDALPHGKVATSVRLVLMDVAFHPDSSISQVTARTGFPQSHVSASVAKLRDLGMLRTEADPADRRRTLVRVTPAVMARAKGVGSAPVEAVLTPVLVGAGPSEVAAVVAALELLGRKLTPNARARLRPEDAS